MTAYEAWTARQKRRDWEDRERRRQEVPAALRESFGNAKRAEREVEEKQPSPARGRGHGSGVSSPGSRGPGLG